jgi:hypothetical protein
MQSIHVRVLESHTGQVDQDTLFVDVRDLFPECLVYTKDSPKLTPLVCFLNNECTVGVNCVPTLQHRTSKLLEAFPNVYQIICKFGIEGLTKPEDLHATKPVSRQQKQRQRGVVFYRTGDVKYISFNSYAYDYRMKKRGTLYRVDPAQLDWYRAGAGDGAAPERDPAIINSNEL